MPHFLAVSGRLPVSYVSREGFSREPGVTAMRRIAPIAILWFACGATITVTPPLNEIKAEAARQWPDDHVRQQVTVEQQTAAYKAMANYQAHDVPVGILNGILTGARHNWPRDYAEQKYFVDQQLDAYRRLHNGHYAHVPESIRSRAAAQWPTDYHRQEATVKDQYAAYLRVLK